MPLFEDDPTDTPDGDAPHRRPPRRAATAAAAADAADGLRWKCGACDAANVLTRGACVACGAARPPKKEGE